MRKHAPTRRVLISVLRLSYWLAFVGGFILDVWEDNGTATSFPFALVGLGVLIVGFVVRHAVIAVYRERAMKPG
jgi:hypothetical protein